MYGAQVDWKWTGSGPEVDRILTMPSKFIREIYAWNYIWWIFNPYLRLLWPTCTRRKMNSIPPSFKPNGSMYVYFRSEDKWIASYRNERITHVCSLKNGTVPKDTGGLVRICIDLWTKIIRHICIIWLINRLKCVIQVSIYKFEAVWYKNGLRCLILNFLSWD